MQQWAAQDLDLLGWDQQVEAWLLAHDRPGNVRELQNTIDRTTLYRLARKYGIDG